MLKVSESCEPTLIKSNYYLSTIIYQLRREVGRCRDFGGRSAARHRRCAADDAATLQARRRSDRLNPAGSGPDRRGAGDPAVRSGPRADHWDG